jgi:HlyD family secretion protein
MAAQAGGSSTLISLLPEASVVKQGDVLATLDASTYDEMLRQQVIVAEQAKSSHLQAQLDYEIALLAVREYHDGTIPETLKSMEGAIALAQSDLSRVQDHLAWSKRMNVKGYTSLAQIASEKHSVAQMDFSLKKQLDALDLFQRFTRRKTEITLQGDVKAAETTLNNEKLRLQRQLDRLALLKKQVDRCTIRAPHAGVLFYANNPDRNILIEEGMPVRQKQELFYLPDLTELEVQVAINESVVDRVSAGMRANVSFEAMPHLTIRGHVASISQIPVQQDRRGSDIRYFFAIVKLEETDAGLKPGMTSRVDIGLARRPHVLAIPHQALRLDGGKHICYVARDDKLERRQVRTGADTPDLVEVTEGLEEGDLIALHPPAGTSYVAPLLRIAESEPSQPLATEAMAVGR